MGKLKMSSQILKWTQMPVNKISRSQSSSTANSNSRNKSNGNNSNHTIATTTPSSTSPPSSNSYTNPAKRWIHDNSLLVDGHVAYLVKFLGSVEVDEPKGLDVVKESIKKLEFQEHLRRSEGEKIKRVELTISVNGVAIRDPKTKNNLHQFPLHRISYCADDKSDRKFLSFITRVQDNSDRHECFVFVGDKLSEEITLTIGQAFDIAYRKYLDASGSDIDARKELQQARKKIQELERKVIELEQKLSPKDPNQDQNIVQDNPHAPKTNPSCQMIDLSLATSKLQSLIDLP